jgi:hypothetical protein
LVFEEYPHKEQIKSFSSSERGTVNPSLKQLGHLVNSVNNYDNPPFLTMFIFSKLNITDTSQKWKLFFKD